jgi:hypothetical protein
VRAWVQEFSTPTSTYVDPLIDVVQGIDGLTLDCGLSRPVSRCGDPMRRGAGHCIRVRAAAGSIPAYSGRSTRTQSFKIVIECSQPIRSAITVAGIRGYSFNNLSVAVDVLGPNPDARTRLRARPGRDRHHRVQPRRCDPNCGVVLRVDHLPIAMTGTLVIRPWGQVDVAAVAGAG